MSTPLPDWAPTSKNKPKGIWSSLGPALLIEAGLVGAAVAWVLMHPPQELQEVIPLVMSMLEEPKVDKPLPPPKPPEIKPPPVPVAKVVPVLKTPVPPQPVAAEMRPVEEPAPPVVAKATAFSTPVAASPPPPPPPPVVASPPQPTVDPAMAYNSKLAAAVQAAFVVPAPATALGFKGRARVEFHLRDGLASNAKIIQPSGLGAVDRAALKAVEAAAFPAPPAALAGKEGFYQIWVACY